MIRRRAMDAVGEAMDHSSSNNTNINDMAAPVAAIVKGKRTKRPRAAATAAPVSSTSSAEFSSSTTEEEEDMANCLILLAQGRALDDAPETEKMAEEEAGAAEKSISHQFTETTANGKAGVYVYQCKTCNKCFPSFQALGGHRTSHKKPKIALPNEEKKPVADEDGLQIGISSLISKPVVTSNNNVTGIGTGSNKPRVHECSICGSEFSSGQALGGHMRRHRPITAVESSEVKKEKNVLSLDLNLPAPADHDDCEELPKSPSSAAAFPFESQQPLVFSASALVDCHY